MKMAAYLFVAINVVITLQGCKDKLQQNLPVANKNYQKAETFTGKNNDSAFYYFNEVTTHSTDSLEIARALNNMAAIQSDAGDYFGAQESLLSSLKFLKENRKRDAYCLSSDYNELGTANLYLKNYTAAIDYYTRAIRFVQDSNYKVIFINNLALAYQKTKDFTKALALYRQLLNKAQGDKKTYARVMTNQATTRWLQDSNYYAAPVFWASLAMRRSVQDDWGINSSYGHLADYYIRSRPDSALFYAEALNASARKLDSPDDELEALGKIIALSNGNTVRTYYERYHFLNDSLQTARNNAKNQFALIRYEAAKSKADNLVLQTENAQKKFQILLQWVLLLAIVMVFAAGILWYRRRQQQTKWAAEKAIQEHELKTSQKVHDVVAGGLYRIMTEIEYSAALDKKQLVDNIEYLYEQSRNISYEKSEQPATGMDEWVAGLLLSYASSSRAILIRGNDAALWQGLREQQRSELEKVLSELMINMKKHSGAQNVVVKFQRKGGQIEIEYTDDGKKLLDPIKYGNGLTGTENRIATLGGKITFIPQQPKGLGIRLYIPIPIA